MQRTINTVRDRYNSMIRVETIKFDPLVSRYFEGEFTVDGTSSSEINNRKSSDILNEDLKTTHETHHDHTDNDFAIKLDKEHKEGWYQDDSNFENGGNDTTNGTTTVNGNFHNEDHDSGTNTTTTKSNDTKTTDGTEDHSERHAVKAAPMNASGVTLNSKKVSGMTGRLSGLSFKYASSYDQGDASGKNHEKTVDKLGSTVTDTHGNGGSADGHNFSETVIGNGVDHSRSGEDHLHHGYSDDVGREYNDERDTTNDGNYDITNTGHSTSTSVSTDNGTKQDSNRKIRHDRYTGRDDVLPQDALKSAMNYLQNYSTAFEWLCNKLEINFIGVYDI